MLLSKQRQKPFRARLIKQGRRWRSTRKRRVRSLKTQGSSSAKAIVEQLLMIIIQMIYSTMNRVKMNQTILQSNRKLKRSMCLLLEEDIKATSWVKLISPIITYPQPNLIVIIRRAHSLERLIIKELNIKDKCLPLLKVILTRGKTITKI